MRGPEQAQDALFIYRSLEERVDPKHPLRALRTLVDRVLEELSPTFAQMYATTGRPSIPPEQLLKALLLQVLYSIRSERQLVEQIDFNLLYRWFVGLSADAPIWHATTFTKNRERLEAVDLAGRFFREVRRIADRQGFLSHDHFTVDGTLLEAAASQKSFRPKAGLPSDSDEPPTDRNPTVNFHGERRSNATHVSRTDPDARLAKKGPGKEAKLCHQASVLTENRHGLIVATDVRAADGRAEVDAAVDLLIEQAPPLSQRCTIGADRGYDQQRFVTDARTLGFTPHVAQKAHSAIDGRTTTSAGYAVSQRKRKLVEQGFGWGKTIGPLRKLRHRGRRRVAAIFAFTCAIYNLVRLRTLLAGGTPA